jgi:hypothetical protein
MQNDRKVKLTFVVHSKKIDETFYIMQLDVFCPALKKNEDFVLFFLHRSPRPKDWFPPPLHSLTHSNRGCQLAFFRKPWLDLIKL